MPKIMIDPGHGGKDPGAVGGSWLEKNINLEAALYIGPRLVEHGFEVGYTRTTDVFDGDLVGRGKKAKGYDYFLSLHCNAGGGTGAEILTNCKETHAYTETALHERLGAIVGSRGIKCRHYNTGAFIQKLTDGKRFLTVVDALDWYGVLRGCWSVGISGNLLEMFFIDSATDRTKFDANRKAVYEAIVQALCEAFGVAYIAPMCEDYKGLYNAAQAEIGRLRSIITEYEAERNVVIGYLGKARDALK